MMKAKVETITPEMAQRYLAQSLNVRGISMTRVNNMMRAMDQGRWELNGDSIKFDSNGVLRDGQHRLMACIEAGVPFVTLVVRGADSTDFVDTNQVRNIGLLMQAHGFSYANEIGAVARLAWRYERGSLIGKVATPDRAELLGYASEHHDALARAVQKTAPGHHLMRKTIPIFVYHMGERTSGSQEIADRFAREFCEGLTDNPRSPAYRLRERMIRDLSPTAGVRKKMTRNDALALAIITWNNLVDGAELDRVSVGKARKGRWTSKTFPRFKHLVPLTITETVGDPSYEPIAGEPRVIGRGRPKKAVI